MKKRKLHFLICTNQEDGHPHISTAIRAHHHHIRYCRMNEELLLSTIRTKKPDVLIIKYRVPSASIFWALDSYNEIAVVQIHSQYDIINDMESLYVGGYSIRENEPFESVLYQIEKHHTSYCKRHLPIEPEYAITALLGYFGLPYYTAGFHYLRAAILLAYHSANKELSIVNEVYPRIAEQFSTKSACVERAIRHTVTCALEQYRDMLPSDADTSRLFSNAKLIALAARWLSRQTPLVVTNRSAAVRYSVPAK